jgi:flagellar basal-body rod protein FlgB
MAGRRLTLGDIDGALRQALDGLTRRQRIIAANIANAETPGYRASEIDFETKLREAVLATDEVQLVATHSGHFGDTAGTRDTEPLVLPSGSTALRNDGNNVDIDREMARLAETQIVYSAVAQMVAGRKAILRMVLSDGRR